MTSSGEIIDSIEAGFQQTTEEIRNQCYKLGLEAFRRKDELSLEVGRSLLEIAEKHYNELKEIEKQMAVSETLLSSFQEKNQKLSEVRSQLKENQNDYSQLQIRLGAMLYEQVSMGIVDGSLFPAVLEDVNREKSLNESGKASFLSFFRKKSNLASLEWNQEKRFRKYATSLLEEKLEGKLAGENAAALLEKIHALQGKLAALEQEEKELGDYVSRNMMNYRSLERGGVKELERRKSEAEADSKESLISYGVLLYEKGDSWIGETTPPEFLDMLQKILELNNTCSQYMSAKESVKKAARADDYKALIAEEEEKIAVLEREKADIDEQIASIKVEIAKLQDVVERLE